MAEIVVDNPVLLEILKRYKDLGTFGDRETIFGIGLYSPDTEYHGFEDPSEFEQQIKIPAFSYYESPGYDGWNAISHCPESLDEVLSAIIDALEFRSRDFDPDLYNELKEELHRREQEIKKGYYKVFYRYELRPGEEAFYPGEPIIMTFTYDPVNGEKIDNVLFEEEDEEEGSEDDGEEDEENDRENGWE